MGNMKEVIETERLKLRKWKVEDKEELYPLASDPLVGPAAGWPPHKSIEESENIIINVLSEENTYAITLQKTGEIIGSIGLFKTTERKIEKEEGELEVGYWIARNCWGKGYAPEAVEAILDYAFTKLGQNRVWCSAHLGNSKSMRVQEKCGFSFSHEEKGFVSQLNEERVSRYTYIYKEDWLKRRI